MGGSGFANDVSPSFVYDVSTGALSYKGEEWLVSSISIESKSGLFVDSFDARSLVTPFDFIRPHEVFLIRTAGVSVIDFGAVLAPRIAPGELAGDLTVLRACPVDNCGGPVTLVYVPEASGFALYALGVAYIVLSRRQSRY